MSFIAVCRAALLGAGALLGTLAHAQQSDSVFARAPHEVLDLAGTHQFALFDQAFYQNKLFLLGESHGVQRVQEVDFALLRHLNQRAGVRTYLAEVDCAQAFYLNEYLHTGEEATLGRVFAHWLAQQAQWGNADFQQKIRRIRQLNQTLPAGRRIRFVGIDGVQDYRLLADYLAALRAIGRSLPPALAGRLDSVAAACAGSPAQAAAVALRTQAALQAVPAARRALGPAYGQVLHVLANLGYARTLPEREAQLLANYQAALPRWHLKGEKLYGLWGLGHVLQSPAQGNYRALAARIRESTLPGHTAVVSILYLRGLPDDDALSRAARRAACPWPSLYGCYPFQPRRAFGATGGHRNPESSHASRRHLAVVAGSAERGGPVPASAGQLRTWHTGRTATQLRPAAPGGRLRAVRAAGARLARYPATGPSGPRQRSAPVILINSITYVLS